MTKLGETKEGIKEEMKGTKKERLQYGWNEVKKGGSKGRNLGVRKCREYKNYLMGNN